MSTAHKYERAHILLNAAHFYSVLSYNLLKEIYIFKTAVHSKNTTNARFGIQKSTRALKLKRSPYNRTTKSPKNSLDVK